MAEGDNITYFGDDLLGGGSSQPQNNFPELPSGAPDPALYMQGQFPTDSPNPMDYMPGMAPPSQTPKNFGGIDEGVNLLDGMMNNHNSMVQNKYMQGQEKLFGTELDNHAFERYYNHPDFDELGFSPFRDNEALYNANSSWLDEMVRATPQMFTLAKTAMADMMPFTFGDWSDREAAKVFEKANAIGASSKGGATGFMTNLYLNAGYTVGIMAELAVEELVLAGATALTMGGASGATIPAMGARATGAFDKIFKGAKVANKALKQLDNLKDIGQAKKFWTGVKGMGAGAGKFLNPLEETMTFAKNYDKLGKAGKLAQTTAGFASFYKDIRNIHMAFDESSLEAGMVENEIIKELTAEFAATHDRPMTTEEADKIRNTAKQAAATTAMANMGTIFYSNKLVFDNLFRGLGPMGLITESAGGKILQKAGKGIARPFEVAEKGVKGLWQVAKDPRSYMRSGLNYFKANLAEGLQETAQETISGAAIDYYTGLYEGRPMRGGYLESVGQNLMKQVSPEGFETFASGFLMGGMVQGPQRLVTTTGKNIYDRIKNGKEGYQQIKAERVEELNKTVNMLNDMYADPEKYLAPEAYNMVFQQEVTEGMERARRAGDTKVLQDLKDSSLYNHVWTALTQGRLDTFTQRLQEQLQLSEEDIQAKFGMSKDEYTNVINKSIERAEMIKQRYDLVQDEFQNPFMPWTYKKGTKEHAAEFLNYKGFEQAQKDLIFMGHSFDRNLERMADILNEAKNDAKLGNTPMSQFNVLFSDADVVEEIGLLKGEIETLKDVTAPEQRKILKEKQNRLARLEAYGKALADYRTAGTEEEVKKAAKKLHKHYKDYVKSIAKTNKDYVFNDALDKAFNKLLDYHDLDLEADRLNASINMIINPGRFSRYAARQAEALNEFHNNRKSEIEASLKAWQKQKDSNDLLGIIDGLGVFFDPAELKDLLENGKMPSTFYDKKTNEPILEGSDKWKEIINAIETYMRDVMESTVTPQHKPSPYNTSARERFPDDKRNYKDLAEQYGFDPEAESSQVPLKDVLQAVINSPHATFREQALAKQLIRFAKDGEYVTFRKDMDNPGAWNSRDQTRIDARYSSFDRKGGSLPIEHVILHEEIHRRTSEELKKDAVFKQKIEELLGFAQRHFSETRSGQAPFYGLKNEAEFVAEAMSNDEFQKFLAEIPYDVQGKTVWEEFVMGVIAMLKNFFGGRTVSNTALNGALNVITNKIENVYGDGTQRGPEAPDGGGGPGGIPGGREMIKQTTPWEVLNSEEHENLMKALIQGYRDYNANLKRRGQELIEPGIESMSDDQIKQSGVFRNAYIKRMSSAYQIIKKYNDDTDRTVEPAPTPPQTGTTPPNTVQTPSGTGIPLMWTIEMKEKFAELGYSEEERRELTPQEGWAIINAGLTAEEREAQAEAARRAEQQELAEVRAGVIAEIDGILAAAESREEVEIAEELIAEYFRDAETRRVAGLTHEMITEKVNARLEEIAFNFNFEQIQVGEVVIMNDRAGTKAKVVRKTARQLKLEKYDDPSKVYTVNANKVTDRIKYRYNTAMERVTVRPEEQMSEEEQTVSNETQQTAQEIIGDRDAIQGMIDEARRGGDSGWLDDVNDCS